VWREALLAQKVLQNRTRGYRHHPQLIRWRAQPDPEAAIAAYLRGIYVEAVARGYAFDGTLIAVNKEAEQIQCTRGQIDYELGHLKAKLQRRDRQKFLDLGGLRRPQPHPLFKVAPGRLEAWEKL
jgi:pyrimidine dimer DNA glycosylase